VNALNVKGAVENGSETGSTGFKDEITVCGLNLKFNLLGEVAKG